MLFRTHISLIFHIMKKDTKQISNRLKKLKIIAMYEQNNCWYLTTMTVMFN